jgi:hypothetical protein
MLSLNKTRQRRFPRGLKPRKLPLAGGTPQSRALPKAVLFPSRVMETRKRVLTKHMICGSAFWSYFFSLMSTDACVFSQLMFRWQLPPFEASAMVKFSTGEDVGETFMSTRANSSPSYL